jgi:hypothetical protein
MNDNARKVRIGNIFAEAVQKAGAFRKGVNVRLAGPEKGNGVLHANVVVSSQDGDFKLLFAIRANDEVLALGPKGPIPRCSLTAESIEGAIKGEIQRELGASPFNED